MEFIIEGGVWFTIPILILGLGSLILIISGIILAGQSKPVPGILSDAILFIGFLCLAYGIFGQVTGMFQAAGAIVRAGEIAPALIWAGLKVSLITVIMGFVVLFYSAIGWFVIRWMRERQGP
ncbi:MAG: hypothetical protein R6V75_03580 [Bacteroidales bacterium]